MKWRRLTLRVDPPDVEIANAVLSLATGAPLALDEPLRGGRVSIHAYVPAARSAAKIAALRRALAGARQRGLLRTARRSSAVIADERWATSWKRYYEPSLLVPGVWIVPSWRARSFHAPHGGRAIVLDPGMAFGTGQHATTRLAATLLGPFVRPGEPMLDIGSGSGILSIVAGLGGARIFASDIDPIAVRATRDNLRRNGIRAGRVVRGAGVPSTFPRAPLIAANITADVLTTLAPRFARLLARDGVLVTSGVTRRGRRGMLAAFAAAGLHLREERRSGEWLAFVHAKQTAR